MPLDRSVPAFHLEPTDDGGVVLEVRSAGRLAPSLRPLAQFLLAVALLGVASLTALRAPWWADGTFLLACVAAGALVWNEARQAGFRLDGALRIDAARRRLERLRGLDALPFSQLEVPGDAVLVLAPATSAVDTRRLIGRMGAPCRLLAVPLPAGTPHIAAEDALWRALSDGEPPVGVPLLEESEYDVVRGMAEALSRSLGWTLFDLDADEPERRLPADLDVPLADRLASWAADPPTSVPRQPWSARAWTDAVGEHLALRHASLPQLVADLVVGVPLVAALYLLSGGNAGVPLTGALVLAFRSGGRTVLTMTPSSAMLRDVVLWLPVGGRREVAWRDVEQVQVVAERGLVGVRLVTDDGSVFLPAASRPAARWAAARVRAYLSSRAPHTRPARPLASSGSPAS